MNGLALVTGIEGFTGYYVGAELQRCGYRVHGLARSGPETPDRSVCDLTQRTAVLELVSKLQPDAVVHLAGISYVEHSDASEIYLSNILGTRNLLEALAIADHKPRLVLVPSSAHVYGNSSAERLEESSPYAPHNDYAISKVAVEHVAALWMDRLPITITRPFNYTGRGQSESFLVPKIVGFARRGDANLKLGNLDVARDFTDVRDLAACYSRILEVKPAGKVLNVCTGRTIGLREIVAKVAHLSGVEFDLDSSPRLRREHEVHRLSGSNEALNEALGKQHFRSFDETLKWMLDGEFSGAEELG